MTEQTERVQRLSHRASDLECVSTYEAEVGPGDVVLFDRGEQHAKGSGTGMTAVMVQVRDLLATRSALDAIP